MVHAKHWLDADYSIYNPSLYKPKVGKRGSNLLFGTSH